MCYADGILGFSKIHRGLYISKQLYQQYITEAEMAAGWLVLSRGDCSDGHVQLRALLLAGSSLLV